MSIPTWTVDAGASASDEVTLTGAYRKVTRHIIPFVFICYLFNYLDRVNVGFGKLQMLDDLKWSETVYGIGAGIFFVGYVLNAVPSNMLLLRFGARRVLGTLMCAWGVASVLLMFARTPTMFYTLRLLAGVFEAGFYPGVVLYFTSWYPASHRGRIISMFSSAVPISGLIGSPLSGWMLHFFAGTRGLAGWQWMFLLQGLPTVVLGLCGFVLLNDNVGQAKWLSSDEKRLIAEDLANDETRRRQTNMSSDTLSSVLRNGNVWVLGMVYFCVLMGCYAISFWLPSIVKSLGFQSVEAIGWISVCPYLCATIFMIMIGRSADRRKERRWHLSCPMLLGVSGLLLATFSSQHPIIAIIGLSIAASGLLSGLPMFWPLPAAFLGSAAAAGGIALLSSVGQTAGFVSPFLIGWLKDLTGSTDVALYVISAFVSAGALLVLRIPARIVNR